MRVQMSPLIHQAFGSIGPTTFKRTKAGLVAQSKSTFRQSRRVRRVNQPIFLALLNHTWHTLTAAQRNAWNAIYTAISNTSQKTRLRRYQSAEALFLSHNLPRLIYSLAAQTTAPSLAMTNAPFKNIIRILGNDWMQIHFEEDALLTSEYAFFEYTFRQPRSHNTPRTWFQNRALYTGPISTVRSIAITPVLTTAQCIWTRIRRHSSSALTSWPTEKQITYG